MAIGDIWELVMEYTVAGQICQNTYGFNDATGSGTAAALVTDLTTHNDANGQNFVQSFMYGKGGLATMRQIIVRDVLPGTAAPYAVTSSVTGGEGTATELLPPQCALVTTWRTALQGRAYRGREYEAGKLEGDQNAGVWVSTGLGNSARHAQWLLDRYGPAGTNPDFAWGVISRTLNKVPRTSPHCQHITSFTQRSTVFSQRRRTIGRGR